MKFWNIRYLMICIWNFEIFDINYNHYISNINLFIWNFEIFDINYNDFDQNIIWKFEILIFNDLYMKFWNIIIKYLVIYVFFNDFDQIYNGLCVFYQILELNI